MTETLIALLLGHLVADFLLQPDWMIARKRRPEVLGLHVAVVALVAWIALGVPPAWGLLALIAASHLAIDAAKILWGGSGFRAFAADQAAHGAMAGLGAALFPGAWAAGIWAGPAVAALPALAGLPSAMALAAGVIATVWAGGYAVGALMRGLAIPGPAGSLPKGGELIGRLERLVILMLVLAGEPAAIGFLIAAKSILRFNELVREEDRHVSEYVIIGTLASFAWAIAAAYATRAGLAAVGV